MIPETHEELLARIDALLAPEPEDRPSTIPPPNARQVPTVRPPAKEAR